MTKPNVPESSPRTILILMSVPESALAGLRSEFPEIRFIVPGESEDQSGRYVADPPEPDAEDLLAADAIVAWRVSPVMLESAPRVRWIQTGGAGVNSFELAAFADRGVILTNASGVAAPNIAEHVLGMMLALARRIPRLVRSQANKKWRDHDTHREVAELAGQQVLVIGMGEIGREVAVRAAAFGMDVRGVRRRSGGELPAGFSAVFSTDELLDALMSADHVVVTLPETARTRGMIDAAAFAAMKPGAMIYNVGRGPVVSTEALIDALRSDHLGGAGLDVTDPEPLPPDSPLWEMENVLITAHTSGSTPRYWDRLGALIAENIRRNQRGEALLNIVDLTEGY
jgi:phosphoglycerate dehydrogenase-like enzyme